MLLRVLLADVDHLRAGIGLLLHVGQGDRVELADGVVALENAGRVLPGDGRAGLHLRPRDVASITFAESTLGHEVVDATLAILVAGVPVLDGRVLDGSVVEGDQFDHRRVQLVLVPHRCGAALEVAHRGAFLGDDEGPLELPGVQGVDPEVRAQFHRAGHALGNEDERAIGEDGRVQGCEEVVVGWDDPSEVLLNQFGMIVHGL